jgi:SAM-dependent methyltransferase
MMRFMSGIGTDSGAVRPGDPAWLEQSYDFFPRIEEAFHQALDGSLDPRGPDLLYDLVNGFGLPAGSLGVDVGCGEGGHTVQLAERFGFTITGIDPVRRHIELANVELAALAAREPAVAARIRFELGSAEELSFPSASLDLVWCRDVLVHVSDLDRAYEEFQRVLRPGGRVLVYQMFAGDRLEPREAEWLWRTMGVVPSSADPRQTETAIASAGLRIEARLDLGTEWGEWTEEQSGKSGQRLLYAARLLRDPRRYITEFGDAAYELMLGDCLWSVYGMIGKLSRRVYVLSRP